MRLVRVAAGAVTVIAVLAGCSDGGTANETLPSVSSSAAETSESLPPLGPPDLPMPDEARKQTEAGALAAGKYFAQLTEYSYQSMDPSGLTNLSSECSYCRELAASISEDRTAGYRYEGGGITFRDAGQVVLSGSGAEVAFSLTQGSLQVIAEDGNTLADRSQPTYDVFTSFVMRWDEASEAWLITQVSNS
ncbi:DUF6318 family protein [Modestobacter versicolor]|uniref:DUF6318 domain-containing protein n=1 Tax=Modestobacter versicolor TaxID=429133 RepID=A0A323VE46_9ACTN|nr:DUF6318 family protein [Modestobacter versicolor]MBB3676955.1 hypothetical protein [Modestobacter versicolor]PZA22871.1 hypothetical protein DMO24_02730 [Modestobacter versicolor]